MDTTVKRVNEELRRQVNQDQKMIKMILVLKEAKEIAA